MVTRKAVPSPSTSAQSPPASPIPPYPTSPPRSAPVQPPSTSSKSVYSEDLRTSPAFDLIDMREAQQRARSNSDSSHGTWDSEGSEREEDDKNTTGEAAVDLPRPLNIRPSQQNMNAQVQTAEQKEELPAILRIGPAKPTVSTPGHGYEEEARANPWSAESIVRSPTNPKNPYFKQNGFAADNSQAAWQATTPPPAPGNAPPPVPGSAPPPAPATETFELPAVKSPAQELEEMSLGQNRTASWETAERFSVPQQGQAPLPPPPVVEQDRPESLWWNESEPELDFEDADDFAPPEPPPKEIDFERAYQPPSGPPPAQSSSLIDHESARPKSPRPTPIETSHSSTSKSFATATESPTTLLQKQRNTTYQIKHVNWLDESPDTNNKSISTLRNSPILTQNANGPCPLLALVNALVLSTPQDVDTSLTQVLSDREQISLGLLLDAVFDELMSNRRAGASGKLPDVSELYSFLLALHTGMNVNPRFVTPATTPRGSWDGVPEGASGMHPMHKAQYKAGAFEETKEMRLYSTFNIPLIHGWTAPVDTPAYEAFMRSAQTFEDAQNIQFLESELEEKKNAGSLMPQEQHTLGDIHTIKAFLATWPTQLTDFGLQTMAKSLLPGQIAILFRNDHFSTIYKEPKHGALMTLVTDAGYATHDEIVWESLVDVHGAASEMFSGDFRVVSHGQDVRLEEGSSSAWAVGNGGRDEKVTAKSPSPPPLPGPRPQQRDDEIPISMTEEQRKAAEQEDHDLALALQLQEEEEDQQRQAEQRRKREQELSEQFLSNEGEGPRPPIPPRRSQGRGTGVTSSAGSTSTPPTRPAVTIPVTTSGSSTTNTPASRAAVSRPTDQPNDPDAPPSYEQAASDRPYRPAGSTPSGTAQGNPLGAYDALRRQSAVGPSTSSLPSFAEAGPASPPYSASVSTPSAANRRTSNSNRGGVRRPAPIGFSVPPQRALVGQGGLAPGHYPGSMQARSAERLAAWNRQQTAAGAAGVRDAEDKCVVM